MLRILHDTNYDFIRWWKVMAGITIAFIVLGLGSLAVKRPNWSIEFTGGTLMQLEFAKPPDVGEIRATRQKSRAPRSSSSARIGTSRFARRIRQPSPRRRMAPRALP
jgi:preprotein translocase subunit SecF